MIEAHIEGMEPLLRRLAFLPAKIQRDIVRKALAPAARLMTKEIRQAVPVDTGATKKSIGQKSKSYGDRAIVFMVGAAEELAQQSRPRAGRPSGAVADISFD